MAEKEYIEREKTIKALKENTTEMESDIYYASNIGVPEDEIEDIVNEIPTADVQEVRHGKWELIDECSNEGVYCSNCHKKVYRTKYANQKIESNYCPNCGTKMDKE